MTTTDHDSQRRKHLAAERQRLSRRELALLLLLLILFVGQAGGSSVQKSAAFDEQYHLTRGYAYLRTGDFRLSVSHPPLINVLSALPLLTQSEITLPLAHPAWEEGVVLHFSDVFMWYAGNDAQAMLVLARLPVIALGTLLALLLFFWARQMVGPVAGWVALFLVVFDPNLLANSRLVTTDLGLTFFFTLAVALFWWWLQKPTSWRLLAVGLAVGCTMTAKFTGIMILPTLLLLALFQPERARLSWQRLGASLVAMGLVGYFALWAVYRFDFGPVGNAFPVPIPAPFYPASGWFTFVENENNPKTSYLLGELATRGWWYYFPVALLVKSSLPFLLLTLSGIIAVVRSRRFRATAVLWLPALLFLLLGMTGRLAIGYRHILPAVPFLIMLAAYGASSVWHYTARRRAVRAVVALLLLWHIAGTLLIYPDQEAYFNELAGGPENGDRILVDSNLDWGQDLISLRRILAEKQIDMVNLAYFGTGVPEQYGIRYHPLPGFLRFVGGPEVNAYNPYTPAPGWYAISRSSLRLGMYYQNNDIYAYFREREPVARAGRSINLYYVDYPPETDVERTVVTGEAVSDVLPQALGVAPGRRVVAKWSASAATTVTPAAAVTPLSGQIEPLTADFAGAFTLVGYEQAAEVVQPGETVTLTLYWEVNSGEVARPAPASGPPLAAFVHLSAEDPAQIVGQYDGWEVALSGLERGDRIAQRIVLPVPPGTPPGQLYLRAGLYSPQSGERLPLAGRAEDFVTFSSVEVRKEES